MTMNTEAYEAVIGLEVHTHLLTRSKIFCGCSTTFGAGPNENVCPICMGMPGVLPVLNRRVVELAIRTGLAAHCTIAPYSIFDRKSYFYPDLPKGYQISQYETPICKGGYIDLPAKENGDARRVRLTRIHIEEDAGKNIHHENASLVDFNRSGVPLIEIVSEPDLRSAEDAGAYLRQLRAILRYVDASDGKMEEGSFRCDCNVSVRKRGATEYGVRTEIKNLNSFRFVEDAIDYEVGRQIAIVESGGKVAQETHLWDPARKETRPMRSKEYANDYRYFPEPDLPPLVVPPEMVEQVRASMPELPADRKARYVREGLTEYEAGVLIADRDVADYFEATLPGLKNRKSAANWVMTEVLRVARDSDKPFTEAVPPATEVGALLADGRSTEDKPERRQDRIRRDGKIRQRRRGNHHRTRPRASVRRKRNRRRDRQGARCGTGQTRRISRRPRQALRLLRRRRNESDGRKSEPDSDQPTPARKARRLTTTSEYILCT